MLRSITLIYNRQNYILVKEFFLEVTKIDDAMFCHIMKSLSLKINFVTSVMQKK